MLHKQVSTTDFGIKQNVCTYGHKEMSNSERRYRAAQVARLAKKATSRGTKECNESQRLQSTEAKEEQN